LGIYVSNGYEWGLTTGGAATRGLLVAHNCPTNSAIMGESYTAGGDATLLIEGVPIVIEPEMSWSSSPNVDGSICEVHYLGLGIGAQSGAHETVSST